MTDAAKWRRSWDVQQEAYVHGREERFAVMLDCVELVAGPPGRVLDLACGTGSIAERTLARFPEAQVTAVDVDPVMLELARLAFDGDRRMEVVERDLRDPRWTNQLRGRQFDAVLTATATHWLDQASLVRLYGDLAHLVRLGGLFANADHMPLEDGRLAEAAERASVAHEERAFASGAARWAWWEEAAADPALSPLVAERERRFAGRGKELMLPEAWHAARLREAGFAVVEAVWRWGNDAVLVAVR